MSLNESATPLGFPWIVVPIANLVFLVVLLRSVAQTSAPPTAAGLPEKPEMPSTSMAGHWADRIEIDIVNESGSGADRVRLAGAPVAGAELDRRLRDVAAGGADTPVIVTCAGESRHQTLLEVLARCAAARLTQVSVYSR